MISNLTIHSGANSTKPNSLNYINYALKCRHSYIEVDVRSSKDNICFLSHDDNIRGKTLSNLCFNEIKNLDSDILSLGEVMDLIKKNNTKLNLDIKRDDYIVDVVKCIEEHDFENCCIITGIHLNGFREIKKLNNRLKIVVNFEEEYFDQIDKYIEQYRLLKPYGINFNCEWLINTKFKLLKNTQIPIFAWTVDTKTIYALCKKNSVVNITTNFPENFYEDF